jgi:HlyD family secretion protein
MLPAQKIWERVTNMNLRILALTMAALLGIIGCGNNDQAPGGSGFIESDEVTVSAEAAGRIITLAVKEGSVINLGDTLAVIDPSRTEIELGSALAARATSEASLKSARLQAEEARNTEKYASSERDRVARLVRSGSATQKQLDQLEYEATRAENARRTAEANVGVIEAQIAKIDADTERTRRQLQDCYLLAPAKGTVTDKFVDAGEVVSIGKSIVKISQLDTVWVKVYLPATEFAGFKIGDKATINAEGSDAKYPGAVIWTSREAEFTPKNVQTEKSRSNLVYAIKISIPNSDGNLKIGMPVYVTMDK